MKAKITIQDISPEELEVIQRAMIDVLNLIVVTKDCTYFEAIGILEEILVGIKWQEKYGRLEAVEIVKKILGVTK